MFAKKKVVTKERKFRFSQGTSKRYEYKKIVKSNSVRSLTPLRKSSRDESRERQKGGGSRVSTAAFWAGGGGGVVYDQAAREPMSRTGKYNCMSNRGATIGRDKRSGAIVRGNSKLGPKRPACQPFPLT